MTIFKKMILCVGLLSASFVVADAGCISPEILERAAQYRADELEEAVTNYLLLDLEESEKTLNGLAELISDCLDEDLDDEDLDEIVKEVVLAIEFIEKKEKALHQLAACVIRHDAQMIIKDYLELLDKIKKEIEKFKALQNK